VSALHDVDFSSWQGKNCRESAVVGRDKVLLLPALSESASNVPYAGLHRLIMLLVVENGELLQPRETIDNLMV